MPNFYARADTRTPVVAAFIALGVFIASTIFFLEAYGVIGVAFASVVGAWINVAFLLIVLASRGHYRMPGFLIFRLAKQALAAAAMGAALYYANGFLTDWYSAGLFARLGALGVLVGAACAVYFGLAFLFGAIDKQRIVALTRKQ